MSDGSTPLRHHRMEAFARSMAAHGDRSRAVREAGYQCARPRQQAYDLLAKPGVQARIEHLRAAREKHGLDEATGHDADSLESLKDDVLASLKETRALALEQRDLQAANRANELLGKTGRMFTDVRRVEQGDPFESMTGEDLERTIMGLLADPLVRGMVQRALARYEAGERHPVGDDGTGGESSGLH